MLHVILFQNNDRRRKRTKKLKKKKNPKHNKSRSGSKQENPPLQEEVERKVSTHYIPRNLQPPALWFYILLEILQQINGEENLDSADKWGSGGKSLLPNKGSV